MEYFDRFDENALEIKIVSRSCNLNKSLSSSSSFCVQTPTKLIKSLGIHTFLLLVDVRVKGRPFLGGQ
jgi:hypothetical protein